MSKNQEDGPGVIGASLTLVRSTDSDLVVVVRDARRSSPGHLLLVRDDNACLPGRRANGLKDFATGERPTGLIALMEGRTLRWIAWSRTVAMDGNSSSRLVFSALGDSFSLLSSSSKALRLRLTEVYAGLTFSWSSCAAGAFCFQDDCFTAAPVVILSIDASVA